MSRTVVKSRFPKIANELKPKLDLVVRETARGIGYGAQQRVPVRTGRLRESIHTEREALGRYAVVAHSNEAWYGHLVEWGTSHSSPHPFLTPAAEAAREPFEHRVRQVLGDL